MKHALIAIIAIVLFAAGAGGAYWYLNQSKPAPDQTNDAQPAAEDATVDKTGGAHGHFPEIPAGAEMCSTHRVPELVCPFCNPENAENWGQCRGHEVPEALCTRCHPILISAFKAEADWCNEHNLPESQCQQCATSKG